MAAKILEKKLAESLVNAEENVRELVKEFLDETESDFCFEYMTDSLSLTLSGLKEKRISALASALDWNWWQNHEFPPEKILDYGQLFALKNYTLDPFWRKERRIKIALKLLENDDQQVFGFFGQYFAENVKARREQVFLASRKKEGLLNFDQVDIKQSSIPGAGTGVFTKTKILRGQPLFLYGTFSFEKYQGEKFSLVDKTFGDYALDQNFGYDPFSGLFDNTSVFPPFVDSSILSLVSQSTTDENNNNDKTFKYLHVGQFLNQNFDLSKVNTSFEYFDWAPLCCVELNRNITKTVSIIAARDIDEGEELFINYGFEYWEGIDLPGKWKNKKEYKDRFNEFKKLLKSDSKGSFRDDFEDWLLKATQ